MNIAHAHVSSILAGKNVRARRVYIRLCNARRSSIMAAELFIARLPSLSNVEVFEAELKTLQSPFLQHLKSRCRCTYSRIVNANRDR